MSKRKHYWKTKAEATSELRKPGPQWFFSGTDPNLRDVTKPVAFDKDGNLLYAPRGIVTKIPWPWR